MTGKDAVVVISWIAATATAVLAATIWLLAQHSAGVHPNSISAQHFQEFKDHFNARINSLEQHIIRLEAGVKDIEKK